MADSSAFGPLFAVTGQIIADLVTEQRPGVDLTPFGSRDSNSPKEKPLG
jgi:hypothetical protein